MTASDGRKHCAILCNYCRRASSCPMTGRPLQADAEHVTVVSHWEPTIADVLPNPPLPKPEELPALTLDGLRGAAALYARLLSATPVPTLFGVTDGKAVGTYVEAAFNIFVSERFTHDKGNAAKGIDFPGLDVDLKVTSVRQPQSSSPFRDATQKVYGLGYHLLIFVYEKTDDPEVQAARLDIQHLIFIESSKTADFQTTTRIRELLDNEANADDIDAFLEERNLPLDEVGRRMLAERVMAERPEIGCLTISNALQWRLQYGRAIAVASDSSFTGVHDLNAQQ